MGRNLAGFDRNALGAPTSGPPIPIRARAAPIWSAIRRRSSRTSTEDDELPVLRVGGRAVADGAVHCATRTDRPSTAVAGCAIVRAEFGTDQPDAMGPWVIVPAPGRITEPAQAFRMLWAQFAEPESLIPPSTRYYVRCFAAAQGPLEELRANSGMQIREPEVQLQRACLARPRTICAGSTTEDASSNIARANLHQSSGNQRKRSGQIRQDKAGGSSLFSLEGFRPLLATEQLDTSNQLLLHKPSDGTSFLVGS